MKWIKASEGSPKESGYYYTYRQESKVYRQMVWWYAQENKWSSLIYEWLDESDEHPTPKVSAEEVKQAAQKYTEPLWGGAGEDGKMKEAILAVNGFIRNAFIDGAEWQASQFRTPAPEGEKRMFTISEMRNCWNESRATFSFEIGGELEEGGEKPYINFGDFCKSMMTAQPVPTTPANGEGKDYLLEEIKGYAEKINEYTWLTYKKQILLAIDPIVGNIVSLPKQ